MTPVVNQSLDQTGSYGQAQTPTQQTQAQAQTTAGQLSQQDQFLQSFWANQVSLAESYESDFKLHPLPLARIKKVMKTDEDVKMISAEAPILFSKACEIFITEITMRAWMHAEENKRRTLQRSDVASAVSKSDQFDFLIDIVPREDSSKVKRAKEEVSHSYVPD
ncbi:histone-fold-containing protein [Basidiobolus meristosporus CBS 931.73]|uniref:Histone-fold-containing protein n=1 Tax=Basidiobolus meristosporus CBS 931.73 TaxID=1314790 RepID=A0A1Y1YHR8_9FUNG|nr:histone-fold-containing protein [Basidiobolus meristosporus CBS 931.73]|eukprot:ORX97580.1 histone-fold-containing protein [Basidiobolus meristosporus CBS 931.73]